MGGIGKTRLALELAYQYDKDHRFPAGVFWMPATGENLAQWQNHFAQLARKTEYLPSVDDIKHTPEEVEERIARHMCRYLALHTDALLLLDNVEKPELIKTAISTLTGGLVQLRQAVEGRRSLEITKEYQVQHSSLFSTFLLSWEKVHDEKTQLLFLLACYFPEASLIPLRLLGCAAGFSITGTSSLEPLGAARLLLQKWSLMEVASQEEIRLHPVLREFGLQVDAAHRSEHQRRLEEVVTPINTLRSTLEDMYFQILYGTDSRRITTSHLEYLLNILSNIIAYMGELQEMLMLILGSEEVEEVFAGIRMAYSDLSAANEILDVMTIKRRQRFYQHLIDFGRSIQRALSNLPPILQTAVS